LIQVEKPDQIRFQATVENRTATALSLRINDSIRTQVTIDGSTEIDGQIAAGRLVDITAHLTPDLSLVARRIRVVQ
jgi:hypothetical protein